MRPIRTVLLAVLALATVGVTPSRADLLTERASLMYNGGGKRWDFITDTSVSGSIRIMSQGITKKLTKLKQSGTIHSCEITYDNDSKVDITTGDYAVFKVSKCDP